MLLLLRPNCDYVTIRQKFDRPRSWPLQSDQPHSPKPARSWTYALGLSVMLLVLPVDCARSSTRACMLPARCDEVGVHRRTTPLPHVSCNVAHPALICGCGRASTQGWSSLLIPVDPSSIFKTVEADQLCSLYI